MKKYKHVEVSERELEDLIRQAPELLEDGLRYVDHQRPTDRGPLDVLLVDSGHALVVAELKVVEDDGMLWQGLDYYDYLSRSIEGIARAYKAFDIEPTQPIRLILVAPSFSQTLLNRCRWIDVPLSLFGFACVRFEDSDEVTPVFHEVSVPSPPAPAVESYRLKDRYDYVTDEAARDRMRRFVAEVEGWDREGITAEPTKSDISMKTGGRVFAYLCPRRNHFFVYTYDGEGEWRGNPVKEEGDVEAVMALGSV